MMTKLIKQIGRMNILFIIILLSFRNINAFNQTDIKLILQSRLPFMENVNDLEIYNNRIYIKSGNDILIGDILENYSVEIRRDYLTINDIRDICRQDSVLFVTTDQSLIAFNLTNATLPLEIWRIEHDKLTSIFNCENNIYVVYNGNQFLKLNKENPQNPSLTQNSFILKNTNITGIEGIEENLFIATSDSGMFSLDISNFLNPEIVSRTYSGLTYKKLLRHNDILVALYQDILVRPEYGTERYDSGIILYSLSDPTNPNKISEYRLSPSNGKDIVMSGRYLYLLCGDYILGDVGHTVNCIYSFDLINPSAPALLDSLSNSILYSPQMMILHDNHIWSAQWNKIVLVNTINPNSLVHSHEIDNGGFARNIDSDSTYIAVTDDDFGLHILDCTIPESPAFIASFSEITDWGDAKIRSGFVYATSRKGGFRIYDLTGIPHEISKLTLPGSGFKIFLKDTLAFIGDGPAGLTIIDIKDKMNPVIVGRLEIENRAIFNVQVQGDYAYVTYDQFGIPGFGVIDISNPANPTSLYTSTVFANYVKGLFADNNRLFVQGDYSEIKVYNISDPSNPEFLTQIETGTYSNWDIFVENNLLYSVRGGIYDVSDLMNPLKLCDMPANSMGIVKSGNNLYVAGGFTGIYSYFLDRTSNIEVQNGSDLNSFDLIQNYPNPFNPTTKITYSIFQPGKVSLTVYDVLGRRVATLVNEIKPTGKHSIDFNGSNFSSGIYFYQLRVNDFVETKKMILLR